MNTEFGDLFAASVRRAASLARAKGMLTLFDCTGPSIRVDDAQGWMSKLIDRVAGAAIDVLRDGFVFFQAEVAARGPVQARIDVACTGTPATHDAVMRALRQLDMADLIEDGSALAADAEVPGLGAQLHFLSIPTEGAVFSLQLPLPQAMLLPDPKVDAEGARAWLISVDPAACRCMERRLQRLGWATKIFADTETAARQLDTMSHRWARPGLVVAYESRKVTLAQARWLWAQLPAPTQVVLATDLASPSLEEQCGEPGVEARPWPFSPSELVLLTRRLDRMAVKPSGHTVPAPLTLSGRKHALVVDDNDVNLVVATGMLQLLGMEVTTAKDGDEAIQACLASAPDLVLMDIHMPRMSGIEAARRLRQMQRQGQLPDFRIVAATADSTSLSHADYLSSGFDGHLMKPLSIEMLDRELRRLHDR